MKYKIGHCALNGEQVWVLNSQGQQVRPKSFLREGYLVFEGERLKVPLCETCEDIIKQGAPEDLQQIMTNLGMSGEGSSFIDRNPSTYEPYETYWQSQGQTVKGVWRSVRKELDHV